MWCGPCCQWRVRCSVEAAATAELLAVSRFGCVLEEVLDSQRQLRRVEADLQTISFPHRRSAALRILTVITADMRAPTTARCVAQNALDRTGHAAPAHMCTGTGLTPPTSALGLGSPRPHLHWGWAHHAHICTGTGLAPPTSALGLGSPRPHLHRDSPRPHLHQDSARRAQICAGTDLAAPTFIQGGQG